jgi:hypothetical protein
VIEEPRDGAKKAMEKFKKWGFRIIVFTVRGNTGRVEEWLKEHEIPYDYVNHNPDQPADGSGKVLADVYIDDRAIRADEPWSKLAKMVKKQLRTKRAS